MGLVPRSLRHEVTDLRGLLTLAPGSSWCQGVGLNIRMTTSPRTQSPVKVAAVWSLTSVLMMSVPWKRRNTARLPMTPLHWYRLQNTAASRPEVVAEVLMDRNLPWGQAELYVRA